MQTVVKVIIAIIVVTFVVLLVVAAIFIYRHYHVKHTSGSSGNKGTSSTGSSGSQGPPGNQGSGGSSGKTGSSGGQSPIVGSNVTGPSGVLTIQPLGTIPDPIAPSTPANQQQGLMPGSQYILLSQGNGKVNIDGIIDNPGLTFGQQIVFSNAPHFTTGTSNEIVSTQYYLGPTGPDSLISQQDDDFPGEDFTMSLKITEGAAVLTLVNFGQPGEQPEPRFYPLMYGIKHLYSS